MDSQTAKPTPSAQTPSGSDWRAIPSAPEWGRRTLSKRERTIVSCAAEAFLADHDAQGQLIAPSPAQLEAVVDAYDLAVGNCSLQLRLAIPGLLRALNWLPAAVLPDAPRAFGWLRKPTSLTSLPLKQRLDYLDRLERHDWAPLTMLLIASKIPMLVPAFEDGEMLAMTGYDRPTTFARRHLSVLADEPQPTDGPNADPNAGGTP